MSLRIQNVVGMAQASLASRLLGRRRPLNIMLAVTDRCTGRCNYCAIPQRRSAEMSLPQIATLLMEAADAGCQRLGIWGGEPLLRADLGQIVAHAKDLGLWVTVDTNGHLIPRRDEALARVDHLNITLDGDREAHDGGRGEGSFDRTMAGMEHAVGRYLFWTITVLNKHNLDQVDWLLDLARRMGFLASFQVLHHNDILGRNDGLWPDEAELRQTLRLLLARKKEGAPIATSVSALEHLLSWPDFTVTRKESYHDYPECLAGSVYCNVDVSGQLYPCSLMVDEVAAPNVVEQGLQGAFDALQPPPCRACSATCFTEYNLLFGLDWRTGLNWVKALGR